jgi:hypothetical protein
MAGFACPTSVRLPICTYKIVDKALWREWRKTTMNLLKCSSASTLSAFFGHHHKSFKQTAMTAEDQKEDVFVAKAMRHGELNEDNAKRAYIEVMGACKILNNGQTSTVYGLLPHANYRQKPAFIMTTPDMIIKRGSIREVVEFKCPYFEIFTRKLRKNRTIQQIALDFCTKNPMGKEGSFLQAAIYGMCEPDIELINVVYYFTDTTENVAIVIYTYDAALQLCEDMVTDAAFKVEHEMSQPEINYKTKSKDKEKLTRTMAEAFCVLNAFYKDETHTEWTNMLEEDCPEECEQDRPEIPGEISCWSPRAST